MFTRYLPTLVGRSGQVDEVGVQPHQPKKSLVSPVSQSLAEIAGQKIKRLNFMRRSDISALHGGGGREGGGDPSLGHMAKLYGWHLYLLTWGLVRPCL